MRYAFLGPTFVHSSYVMRNEPAGKFNSRGAWETIMMVAKRIKVWFLSLTSSKGSTVNCLVYIMNE